MVADATAGAGIAGAGSAVGSGVNNQHHTDQQTFFLAPRLPRCFRHHVQMASCGDCRAAYSARLARQRERASAARDAAGTMGA